MNALGNYLIKSASLADAELLAEQRTRIYKDIINPADINIFRQSTTNVYKNLLDKNELFAWFIEFESKAVAGAGLIIKNLLPNTTNPKGCTGAFIVQLYTEPAYRRRGFAKLLMNTIMEWCRNQNIERVTLQATADGIPLYKTFGFTSTKEMRLDLARPCKS